MEQTVSFAITKQKIVKTDEILRKYLDVNNTLKKIQPAYKQIKAKYEQTHNDLSKLSLEHERLNFTFNSIKDEYARLESEHESLKVQYSELEGKYGQKLNECQLNQVKIKQLEDQLNVYVTDENKNKENELKKDKALEEKCKSLKESLKTEKNEKNKLLAKNTELTNELSKLNENHNTELYKLKNELARRSNEVFNQKSEAIKHRLNCDNLNKKIAELENTHTVEINELLEKIDSLNVRLHEQINRNSRKSDKNLQETNSLLNDSSENDTFQFIEDVPDDIPDMDVDKMLKEMTMLPSAVSLLNLVDSPEKPLTKQKSPINPSKRIIKRSPVQLSRRMEAVPPGNSPQKKINSAPPEYSRKIVEIRPLSPIGSPRNTDIEPLSLFDSPEIVENPLPENDIKTQEIETVNSSYHLQNEPKATLLNSPEPETIHHVPEMQEMQSLSQPHIPEIIITPPTPNEEKSVLEQFDNSINVMSQDNTNANFEGEQTRVESPTSKYVKMKLRHKLKQKMKLKKMKIKQQNRIVKRHKPQDNILQALLTLKRAKINFTITNENQNFPHYSPVYLNNPLSNSIRHYNPVSNFNPTQNVIRPKRELIVHPFHIVEKYKNRHYSWEKLNCFTKSCRKDVYVLLNNQRNNEELLGFFEVKREVVTPSTSRIATRNSNASFNLPQLAKLNESDPNKVIDTLAELVSERLSKKRKRKVKNYSVDTDSFRSETETELEKIFEKPSVLMRNKTLLQKAKEQKIDYDESSNEPFIFRDSVSDNMLEDDSRQSFAPEDDSLSQTMDETFPNLSPLKSKSEIHSKIVNKSRDKEKRSNHQNDSDSDSSVPSLDEILKENSIFKSCSILSPLRSDTEKINKKDKIINKSNRKERNFIIGTKHDFDSRTQNTTKQKVTSEISLFKPPLVLSQSKCDLDKDKKRDSTCQIQAEANMENRHNTASDNTKSDSHASNKSYALDIRNKIEDKYEDSDSYDSSSDSSTSSDSSFDEIMKKTSLFKPCSVLSPLKSDTEKLAQKNKLLNKSFIQTRSSSMVSKKKASLDEQKPSNVKKETIQKHVFSNENQKDAEKSSEIKTDTIENKTETLKTESSCSDKSSSSSSSETSFEEKQNNTARLNLLKRDLEMRSKNDEKLKKTSAATGIALSEKFCLNMESNNRKDLNYNLTVIPVLSIPDKKISDDELSEQQFQKTSDSQNLIKTNELTASLSRTGKEAFTSSVEVGVIDKEIKKSLEIEKTSLYNAEHSKSEPAKDTDFEARKTFAFHTDPFKRQSLEDKYVKIKRILPSHIDPSTSHSFKDKDVEDDLKMSDDEFSDSEKHGNKSNVELNRSSVSDSNIISSFNQNLQSDKLQNTLKDKAEDPKKEKLKPMTENFIKDKGETHFSSVAQSIKKYFDFTDDSYDSSSSDEDIPLFSRKTEQNVLIVSDLRESSLREIPCEQIVLEDIAIKPKKEEMSSDDDDVPLIELVPKGSILYKSRKLNLSSKNIGKNNGQNLLTRTSKKLPKKKSSSKIVTPVLDTLHKSDLSLEVISKFSDLPNKPDRSPKKLVTSSEYLKKTLSPKKLVASSENLKKTLSPELSTYVSSKLSKEESGPKIVSVASDKLSTPDFNPKTEILSKKEINPKLLGHFTEILSRGEITLKKVDKNIIKKTSLPCSEAEKKIIVDTNSKPKSLKIQKDEPCGADSDLMNKNANCDINVRKIDVNKKINILHQTIIPASQTKNMILGRFLKHIDLSIQTNQKRVAHTKSTLTQNNNIKKPVNTSVPKSKEVLINDKVSEIMSLMNCPVKQSKALAVNTRNNPSLKLINPPRCRAPKRIHPLDTKVPDIQPKAPNLEPSGRQETVPNRLDESPASPTAPKSPEPEVEEIGLPVPKIIPLETPAYMIPNRGLKLLNKLTNFAMEEKLLNEIVQEFSLQKAKLVARYIMVRIGKDKDEVTNQHSPAPMMSNTQRIMLGFMIRLNKLHSEDVFEAYLRETESKFFTQHKNLDIPEIMPLVRLYMGVCKMRNDLNRIRRFCCEAFYFMGDLAVPLFYAVISSWAEVMPLEIDSERDPLAKVLVKLVYMKNCNMPGYNLLTLKRFLQDYHKYSSDVWSSEDLFKELLHKYLANPGRLSDFSILVFCKNHEDKWVDKRINETFKPLLFKVTSDNFKAAILILLGNIYHGFRDAQLINEHRKFLLSILQDTDSDVVKRSIHLSISRINNIPKENFR